MNYKQILIYTILLLSNQFLIAQNCECSSEDYKKWNQGGILDISGEINFLESSNIIIKDKTEINKGNMLAVKSRINKYHNGYYFDYNIYFQYKIDIPKKITIKLMNNKGNSFSIESEKAISEPYEYYNYISVNDSSFKDFINSGIITKIDFIDSTKQNKVLAYFFLSINESIDLVKIFCCSIKLKKEILGQQD
ncbi:hypothetical protein [Algibacter sp. L4_22]|uniref:hypothetical protein n=1 Tax=Algibacter sp. L4_22 TaxID=2942477 RepID=UPI00201B5A5C|nr:hypothetical protein [Algibacter sp. L4_22]MCL5130555.1 hypothetical protein [Algibacter sp. L4_22]